MSLSLHIDFHLHCGSAFLLASLSNVHFTAPKIIAEQNATHAKNKIVFDLKNNQEEINNITWVFEPEKVVTVTISNFKDENLNKYLFEKFEELKEALK